MKKLFIFLIFGILLAMPLISASDWDNILDYSQDNLKVTLKNSILWIIPTSEIGTAELKSHSSVNEVRKVGAGNQVVMWYDFSDFKELYKDGLGEVYLIDMRTGEEIDRDYSFVYWGEKERDVYGQGECFLSLNGTQTCESIVVGKETYETWLPYNSIDIPKGDIRIGLMTYVEIDDEIDGVWTIVGRKMSRHAEWTADLNVGLVSYYKLDRSSGAVIDSHGDNDGINVGATRDIPGKINDSFDFEADDTEDRINLTDINSYITTNELTISLWVKIESTGTDNSIFSHETNTSASSVLIDFNLGKLRFIVWNSAGNLAISQSSNVQSTGQWYHVVGRYNGTSVTSYLNGTQEKNVASAGGTIRDSTRIIILGSRPEPPQGYFDGLLDEVGIWNRSLTQAEITQLYNSGTGITYPALEITLLSPQDTANFTTNTINFSANVFENEEVGIQNVTLEVVYPNGTLFYDETNTSGFEGVYNWTDISIFDGDWNWSVIAYDDANEIYESERVFNINTTPFIQFENPTPVNYYNSTSSYVPINVSLTETYFNNITFSFYNDTLTEFYYEDSTRFINESLADGIYSYNITVWTTTDQTNSTETRNITIDTINPNITSNSSVTFDFQEINTNLTIYFNITEANPDTCLYDYNETNISIGCGNTSVIINTTTLTNKNIIFYANDTFGHETILNVAWDYKIFQESITYNETSYVTDSEGYLINITANSSLTASNLIYNGNSYTGTQSGSVWSRTLILGSGDIGNNTFYWSFTYDSDIINSSTHYQNISAITFVLCNATYNIPFLNFTFKDEGDDSVLNASNDLTDVDYWIGSSSEAKSYITSSSTEDYDYTFCFSPSDKTVIVDLIFKYSKDGYPLRTFAYEDQELTNTTTNKVLYLLGTIDGIYSSISVIESAGGSIPGVTIQIERQFGGVWTLISQDVTGSDGVATFWVNPNFQHRITATKTNYVTTQVTITPSQTLYTLTMQRTTAEAEYTSDLPGIKWVAYPQSGTIPPGIRSFNITVTSSESNLENCKFELVNATNSSQVLDYVISITNSSYCFLNINYNAQENTKFFGRLSLDTTETTGYVIVNTDWKWIVIDIEVKGWRTITSFFADLTTLSEFGEGNEAEFSKIVTFFLITTIIFGVFIYFSGIELTSPGITILLIWGITLFASAGGFLTFSSGSSNVNPVIEQYGFFFIFTIYMINYFMTIIRRANE